MRHHNGTERVAIVGAGLAGLHAAYRLRQAGVLAQIYVASTRVGGRMFTARSLYAPGQVAEPEANALIKAILEVAYVGEFGLEADDQSVFNVFRLINFKTPEAFRLFGESDERFHIRTGSDTLTTRLAECA